jgi:hypothetical protein
MPDLIPFSARFSARLEEARRDAQRPENTVADDNGGNGRH